MMPGEVVALVAVGLFALGWGLWARALARRLAFADAGDAVELPLPTAGHHITVVHHPSPAPRFADPVVLCHGLAVNRFNVDFLDDGRGSDRVSLARFLARAGFDVWVVELRGRGRSRVPARADWTIDDEVDEDVPTAIQHVLERTGAPRLFWVGHSKGSILQYLFQAGEHPLREKVAGLVAIGSPGTLRYNRRLLLPLLPLALVLLPLFGRVPLRALSLLGLPAAGLLRWLGRPFVKDLAHIDAPMLARVMAAISADISAGVARQFLAAARAADGAFRRRDGFVYESHFAKIAMPTLFFAGVKDRLAPPAAVEFVAERIASEDRTLYVMGKGLDASVDFGHGDLVVGPHAPTEVFPRVRDWLAARARPLP